MIQNLSPKELAMVIGVSESSLKRWVDEGRLVAARTAGGHRRIPLHEAVRFIRDTSQQLARPELLGLVPRGLTELANGDGSVESATLAALEDGDSERARALLIGQFLATRSVPCLFDGAISHAMHRIGELWNQRNDGIVIEHRATEICLEAVRQIRMMLPPPAQGAPVAVGSAAPGDPYRLATLMAATTLLEAGYRDVNLGPDLPFDSLISAAKQNGTRLVWVSFSVVKDRAGMLRDLQRLAETCADLNATLVLGGRGVYGTQNLGPLPNGTHVIASMAELAAMARAVRMGEVRVERRGATAKAS